jgi:quercetin dioxygenase-like cupin family protein
MMLTSCREVTAMRLMGIMTVFCAGLMAGRFLIPTAVAAQTRSGRTTNLMTTDLSGWCDGKEVTVEVNDFGPGTSGRHYHPGHSFTWILEGSESYTLEGQPARNVTTGDLLHEAPMQVHTLENQAPVKLLVLRVAEKGKLATVRLQ